MALTSSIKKYDDKWPMQFSAEARRLRPIFGEALVSIDHVGSTAVVGLAAKPEIDVLITVFETKAFDQWGLALIGRNYKQGKDLQTGHHFFKRDVDGVRTHKLHICKEGHTQVKRMLAIRDHLLKNHKDRAAYEQLKLHLERENQHGIAEYLDGKAPFLDDLYQKIQLEG